MKELQSLYYRIRRVVGRGRGITQDDTGPVQLTQLRCSDLETFDDVPRVAEYGLASNPPDGWDGVAVFFGGDRSSGVVIATNHQQFRLKNLGKGESALYDNQGQVVYLRKSGILIKDKAGSTVAMNGDGTGILSFGSGLTIDANTKIVGTLEVTENITADQDVTVSGMSVKNHNHTDPQGGVVGNMQG